MKFLVLLMGSFSLNLIAHAALAQTDSSPEQGFTRFDEHTVYHSVFNSTMVQADIAKLHELTRGNDRVLVNVALVPSGSADGGQAAEVSGSVTNLMQQKKELQFKAIVEDGTTYYLAPLRITNEEVLHFDIEVNPTRSDGDSEDDSTAGPYNITFSKKLYVDQ